MDSHKFLSLTTFFLLFQLFQVSGQSLKVIGHVHADDGTALSGVSISLRGTAVGTATRDDGSFELSSLSEGRFTMTVSSVGYIGQSKDFTLKSGQDLVFEFVLKSDAHSMEEALILGKTEAQQLKETGFNVNAIDVKAFANSNRDINQILNASSGIRIRENGGLGSDFNFSMNGLSGRQVKFFIDGIPMENFGGAMSLNNIPVNLAERIEIYKGVVPAELGADALGGAVNIVTAQNTKRFLDASYSYGSFNTHRASLNGSYSDEKTGFVINASGFYNYADNNYLMRGVEIEQNGAFVRRDFRRFNDAFHSAMGQVEVGLRNKKWADLILIGFLYSDQYKERQTGVDQDMVYGKVHSFGHFVMPTLKYKKENFFVKGLTATLFATYATNNTTTVDTSASRYGWDGKITAINQNFSEQGAFAVFKYTNKFAILRTNLSYQLNANNALGLNYNLNAGQRKGINTYKNASQEGNALDVPNKLGKGILGLSWQSNFLNERLTSSVFAKHYQLHTYIREAVFYNGSGYVKQEAEDTRHFFGYGAATRFKLFESVGLKASFEHAFRLPEVEELFGDGISVLASPALRPEESDNINVGAYFTKRISHHKFTLEAAAFSRTAKDFINAVPGGTFSSYTNVGKVAIKGFDGELKYSYKNLVFANFNASYTDATNIDRKSAVYQDRIPNQPWLYANADIGLGKNDVFRESDRLQFNWFSQYVHWFYLTWPSRGYEPAKSRIPTQLIHNATISYSLKNGKYNISLESRNLLDELAFDNFRLQKPGRSFNVKLRYFLQ
ncbi:TonB-dependent receptor [Dyadobacter sp. CY312]|uniref:TonB-dependent receptor n=1 Tax=Dyadobacter sp. CY312 TaxID=2907303 RepID=UPI001F38A6A9|nr:TonB-dependent receptor [Dyadobacter sp. CY312]MCE7042614.1 TonB-dependent receptor plug domain-containing protein [Dyadobacter sp. CY312]